MVRMRMQKTTPAMAYPRASQRPATTNQMMLSRVRTAGPLGVRTASAPACHATPTVPSSCGRPPGDGLVIDDLAGLDEPQARVETLRDEVLGVVGQREPRTAGPRAQGLQGLDDGRASHPITLVRHVDEDAAEPAAAVLLVDAPHEEPDDPVVDV